MGKTSLEVLVEALVASEVQKRFDLPLAMPPDDGRSPDPTHGLSIRGDLILGGLPIDESMIFVLTNWAKKVEEGGAIIDPELAASLDFLVHYDRAQEQFIRQYLNPVVQFGPYTPFRASDRSVDEIYELILTEATFADQSAGKKPKAVTQAEELLYGTDEDGQRRPTAGYLRFLELEAKLLDAELELDELPPKASDARRKKLQSQIDRALTALNVEGRRREFEHARQLANAYAAKVNTEDDRTRLVETLEAAKVPSIAEPGHKYPATSISPLDTLVAEPGRGEWQSFEFQTSDIKSALNKKIAERLDTTLADLHEAASGLHAIRFTLCLFDIHRTWLDWNFLIEKYWDLKEQVSDGKGSGLMPAVADGVVVIRDMDVTELVCTVTDHATGEKGYSPGRRSNQIIASQQKLMSIRSAMDVESFRREAKQIGIRPPEYLLKPVIKRSRVTPKATPKSRSIAALAAKRIRTKLVRPELFKGLREKPKPEFRARAEQQRWPISGSIRIGPHADLVGQELKFSIILLHRGEPTGKALAVEPKDGMMAEDFDFEMHLQEGAYRFSVSFRGEMVYRKDFRIDEDAEPSSLDLGVEVTEESIVSNRGALNLFGYRSRRVPLCPNPDLSFNWPE